MLQAELTDTLKRRKPIVINEPSKYQYPTFNANSEQCDESSNKIKNSTNNNQTIKPVNVNAVLSVVSGIKLPDAKIELKTDTNNVTNSKPKTLETTKITHGKPNFKIERKISKPNCIIERKDSKQNNVRFLLKQLSFDKTQNNDTKPKLFENGSIKPNSFEVSNATLNKKQTEMKSPTLLQNAIKTVNGLNKENSKPKIVFTMTDIINKPSNETNSTITTMNSSKISQSSTIVANRKALFEKSDDDKVTKPMLNNTHHKISNISLTPKIKETNKINLTHRMLNPTQNTEYRPTITAVNPNKNISSNSLVRPLLRSEAIDKTDHYDNTVFKSNGVVQFPQKNATYDNKNFEQKTIISFSKELHSAPNKYPDQIRVTRTVKITESSHVAPESVFKNIRFSISPNAQVVPKKK